MTIKESFLRDVLRLVVWYPFRWLIYWLPVPVSFFLYRRMGDVHYLVDRKKRETVVKNLQKAFKDKDLAELRRITRLNMQTHYLDRLIVFVFPKLNRKNIDRIVSFEGRGFLDQALVKGKGCILVHAHYGPAQLSLCALGYKGYKMNQLGFRTTEGISKIGREIQAKIRLTIEENKIPAKMLYVNKFMRATFKVLSNNEVLMTAGDAGGTNRFIGKYVTVRFLENRMCFPTGWASLAIRTGAPVVPLSLHPDGGHRYRVILGPPFDLDGNGNMDTKIIRSIERYATYLEADVRKYPHEWHFWDEFYEGNLLIH